MLSSEKRARGPPSGASDTGTEEGLGVRGGERPEPTVWGSQVRPRGTVPGTASRAGGPGDSGRGCGCFSGGSVFMHPLVGLVGVAGQLRVLVSRGRPGSREPGPESPRGGAGSGRKLGECRQGGSRAVRPSRTPRGAFLSPLRGPRSPATALDSVGAQTCGPGRHADPGASLRPHTEGVACRACRV